MIIDPDDREAIGGIGAGVDIDPAGQEIDGTNRGVPMHHDEPEISCKIRFMARATSRSITPGIRAAIDQGVRPPQAIGAAMDVANGSSSIPFGPGG
jgi:hypothetical protein